MNSPFVLVFSSSTFPKYIDSCYQDNITNHIKLRMINREKVSSYFILYLKTDIMLIVTTSFNFENSLIIQSIYDFDKSNTYNYMKIVVNKIKDIFPNDKLIYSSLNSMYICDGLGFNDNSNIVTTLEKLNFTPILIQTNENEEVCFVKT